MDAELAFEARDPDAVQASIFLVAGDQHEGEPAGRAPGLVVAVVVPRQDQVNLTSAVGDEDLLAVDLDGAVGEIGRPGRDAAEVAAGLGFGQIHAALDFARRETRQPFFLELLRAEFLDVVGGPGLQADHHHQARIGARDHLDHDAVQECRESVATIGLAHGQADQTRLAQLVVGAPDVGRGRCTAVVGERRFLGPVLACVGFEALGQAGRRLEDRPVGADLGVDVDRSASGKPEQGFPIDLRLQIQPLGRSEVVTHPLAPSPSFLPQRAASARGKLPEHPPL